MASLESRNLMVTLHFTAVQRDKSSAVGLNLLSLRKVEQLGNLMMMIVFWKLG